jgi:hypothetical protein
MYILEKLYQQINSLKHNYESLKIENARLSKIIDDLNNNNDRLQFNNENMLLNIDKALHITKVTEHKTISTLDDIEELNMPFLINETSDEEIK